MMALSLATRLMACSSSGMVFSELMNRPKVCTHLSAARFHSLLPNETANKDGIM